MKIYLIKRSQELGYDMYRAHIIAAERPLNARHLAAKKAADEGTDVWLDARHSTIFCLAEDSKIKSEKILLSDFNAG